jgi:uncharacterized membrane protein YeaQ/YmgE (transglycosylase-associated protein family)
MNILPLLLQLLSGAAAGNLVGAASEKLSLGLAGNLLAGIFGGGVGGQILKQLAGANAGTPDVSHFLINFAGGGIGGMVMLTITAWIRNSISSRLPPR